MTNKLKRYFFQALSSNVCDHDDYLRITKRIKKGKLIREQNLLSHICAMFVPFDINTKKVFIVHHKKANSWVFPGGHVDSGELPPETIIREGKEELGLNINDSPKLFSIQILDIDNPPQVCREHYDLFFTIPVSPADISINCNEFYDVEWSTIPGALEKISHEYYKKAFRKFISLLGSVS